MRVTLKTAGGVAGLRRPSRVVDTTTLSPDLAEELMRLLAAASTAAAPLDNSAGRTRDGMAYIIRSEHDGPPVVLHASDTAMSPEFAALLDWLEFHFRSAAR